MGFIKIQLSKCVLYIKPEEIHKMLLQPMNHGLFLDALKRGKAFSRTESKKQQYLSKFSEEESKRLDDWLQ